MSKIQVHTKSHKEPKDNYQKIIGLEMPFT